MDKCNLTTATTALNDLCNKYNIIIISVSLSAIKCYNFEFIELLFTGLVISPHPPAAAKIIKGRVKPIGGHLVRLISS